MNEYNSDKIGLLLDQSIRSDIIQHNIQDYEYSISLEESLALRDRWIRFFEVYDRDRKSGILFHYYKI